MERWTWNIISVKMRQLLVVGRWNIHIINDGMTRLLVDGTS